MICCPHCGKSIAAAVSAALCEQTAAAGRIVTEKRRRYLNDQITNVNSAYTPEKRKAAMEKPKKTLVAKRQGRRVSRAVSPWVDWENLSSDRRDGKRKQRNYFFVLE